jgi:hypothetical protein
VDVKVAELAQQMGWFPLRGYFSSDTYPIMAEFVIGGLAVTLCLGVERSRITQTLG